MPRGRKCTHVLLIVLFVALASPAVVAEKKSKKKNERPRGTPVLWRARDVASLDLFAGPGGEQSRPDLRRVRAIKVEKGGYSPKVRVIDGAGHEWVAKLGKEAQSETAATRLVWAAGYRTEVTYLVPCVRIEGLGKLPKKVERCQGSGYANVRFEARPEGIKRLDKWKWKQNPFVGTRELQGLKVMMALLNNWDMKDENNVILYVPGEGRANGELLYAISDLGATFGRATGGFLWRIRRSRNEPRDYAKSKFISKVKRDYVDFNFTGMNSGLLNKIRVEDARWVGQMLARLSDAQISDAFRAANYTPEETQTLTDALRRRINELVNLPRKVAAVDALTDDDGVSGN
jgi:hypothetical protein